MEDSPTRAVETRPRGAASHPGEVDFSWLAPLLQRLRRPSSLSDRWMMLGGGVVAALVALWLTAGAWGPEIFPGDDTTAHMIRARFAIDNIITRGRVDGWQPSFILGYQEFLFVGPGFTWAVALAQVLSLGLLSTVGAVKVVSLVSFVAVPLSVVFAARSFGLDRRASGIAAILSLAVNNPFGGIGVQGLFGVGLVTHTFAAPMFFLALGGLLRVLRDPDPRWIAFTAATLGALFMSHGISVMILGVVFAIILAILLVGRAARSATARLRDRVAEGEVRRRLAAMGVDESATVTSAEHPRSEGRDLDDPPTREGLRRLALAGLLAAALAACVLLPIYMHRDLQLIFTSWGTPPIGSRVSEIWHGHMLFRPGVTVIVLMGLVYGLVRVTKGGPYALALVLTPLVYLPVAHISQRYWPGSVVPSQLTSRGLGYVAVLAVLPLAALLARVSRDVGTFGDIGALLLAAAIVIIPVGPTREITRNAPDPVPELHTAARQLAALVPDGARFATERDWPSEVERLGLTNPDRWLAWASGRNTLNSFNVESSMTPSAAGEPEKIMDKSPEEVADALSRLGVTHLVTVSDEAAAKIGGSARFSPVWVDSPIGIFSVTPRPGQPDPAALITANQSIRARLVEAEPEHVVMLVESDQPVRAAVPIGWSPKWHASVNGQPVKLQMAQDGLLELDLPAGPSRVELEFRRDVWDYLGLAITLATIILGARWLLRRRREARSHDDRGDPSPTAAASSAPVDEASSTSP